MKNLDAAFELCTKHIVCNKPSSSVFEARERDVGPMYRARSDWKNCRSDLCSASKTCLSVESDFCV